MTLKKSLLAVFPQLPFPEYAGDRQKVNNLIRILSKHYELDVVLICRTRPSEEDHNFLKTHTVNYRIFYLNKLHIFLNVFKGVLRGEALQVGLFYNNEVQRYINARITHNDIVFCNLIRTAKYAAELNKEKFIDIVDSLSINYKRSLDNVNSILWKFIYKYEYSRLFLYEEQVMRSFNASFLVNSQEQIFWQQRIPNKRIIWLSQGVKPQLFSYSKSDNRYSNGIMFIGKMDYQPNIDAVSWFLKKVWPFMNINIDFFIVGVNPPKSLTRRYRNDARIKFLGYVQDPYLVMNSCKAVVSPMQTGGGIQNKILEGMALGKINIATSLGASSIYNAIKNKHILIEDNPAKMALLIEDVCLNQQGYNDIAAQGKTLVSSTFTWGNFEKRLIQTMDTNYK